MEGFLLLDTILEYYLGIDPRPLPNRVWAWKLRHLEEIRKLEAKGNK